MSFGKRCVFQLSSISIRILSHTLILRLGYTLLVIGYCLTYHDFLRFLVSDYAA